MTIDNINVLLIFNYPEKSFSVFIVLAFLSRYIFKMVKLYHEFKDEIFGLAADLLYHDKNRKLSMLRIDKVKKLEEKSKTKYKWLTIFPFFNLKKYLYALMQAAKFKRQFVEPYRNIPNLEKNPAMWLEYKLGLSYLTKNN